MSGPGEIPLHQMAELLAELLEILSRHCNLPGSTAIIKDLSAAKTTSKNVQQVPLMPVHET
jgi:hypothetical protein